MRHNSRAVTTEIRPTPLRRTRFGRTMAFASRLRPGGVGLREIAERGGERPEPRRERLPLPDPVAVDRTTDLLARGGADRAGRSVELEAGRLEREPEIVEQRADLGFRIVEQALVDHAVDAAGQHAVVVVHRADVVGVVAADVLEAVGERLALGEVLAEVRDAA